MTLKLYVDRMSQPSRAVLIFCKVNGIDFEEVIIQLDKGKHRSPEFQEINPMKQVPAIEDGRLKLFESHAILRYLACAFAGVADHWYPADLYKRAKIDSVLDWHHANLRRGAVGYALNTTLAPALGLPLNPQAAAEAEKVLLASLDKMESFWLQGNGRFLLGSTQPSIADLSLVCELMQLEVVEEKDRGRILRPYQRVLSWIDDMKKATTPHFDEIHTVLFNVKARLQKHRSDHLAPWKTGIHLHSDLLHQQRQQQTALPHLLITKYHHQTHTDIHIYNPQISFHTILLYFS